ncbi:MAG: DUF1801 domain-containing protein [Lysobacteraceae bacterium]
MATGKVAKKATRRAAPRTAARPAAPAPRRRVAQAQDSAAARIDRRIAALGDWRGERLARIRALVRAADPAVVEDWKWMGTPVWSCDGMRVLANAHKDKVKVTFLQGARLADPDGLFNAGLTGNQWRAIDLREGARLDEAAFTRLLREAITYHRMHAVPKSRGSRA